MLWFGTIWWPFIRLSAFFWALPVYDNPAVTPRARIVLALFLSFLLSAGLEVPAVDPFSVQGAIVTLEQILFAVIMACAVRMLFEVLALVGLGVEYHDAEMGVLMLAFLVFLGLFLWSFAATSIARVWVVLAGGAALLFTAAWAIQRAILS